MGGENIGFLPELNNIITFLCKVLLTITNIIMPKLILFTEEFLKLKASALELGMGDDRIL